MKSYALRLFATALLLTVTQLLVGYGFTNTSAQEQSQSTVLQWQGKVKGEFTLVIDPRKKMVLPEGGKITGTLPDSAGGIRFDWGASWQACENIQSQSGSITEGPDVNGVYNLKGLSSIKESKDVILVFNIIGK